MAGTAKKILGAFRRTRSLDTPKVVPLDENRRGQERAADHLSPDTRNRGRRKSDLWSFAEKAAQYIKGHKPEPLLPVSAGVVPASPRKTSVREEKETRASARLSWRSTTSHCSARGSQTSTNKQAANPHGGSNASASAPPAKFGSEASIESVSEPQELERRNSKASLTSQRSSCSRVGSKQSSVANSRRESIASGISTLTGREALDRQKADMLLQTASEMGGDEPRALLNIYEEAIVLLERLDDKKVKILHKKCQTLRKQIAVNKIHRDDGEELGRSHIHNVLARRGSHHATVGFPGPPQQAQQKPKRRVSSVI
eukprot:TRINITY_DN102444_c0_g1_i1.p1 TRINITY_DN102444_c0_g1~~TRINITY_DN102444_c0_g1_i1.p1  ORF type:complete len:314 (-),score=57.10 TRINITY_DN102444_c0_g1_i1:139-1080(-)